MFRRPIHDEVMGLASRLADKCHPQVAQKHADELARYARLTSACTALESFSGCRPRMDDDAFDVLARRRSQVNVINLSCSPAQGKPPKQPAAMAVGR